MNGFNGKQNLNETRFPQASKKWSKRFGQIFVFDSPKIKEDGCGENENCSISLHFE